MVEKTERKASVHLGFAKANRRSGRSRLAFQAYIVVRKHQNIVAASNAQLRYNCRAELCNRTPLCDRKVMVLRYRGGGELGKPGELKTDVLRYSDREVIAIGAGGEDWGEL